MLFRALVNGDASLYALFRADCNARIPATNAAVAAIARPIGPAVLVPKADMPLFTVDNALVMDEMPLITLPPITSNGPIAATIAAIVTMVSFVPSSKLLSQSTTF